MKIGFDIHDVIDKHPDKYKEFIRHLGDDGVEIHILTGLSREKAKIILAENNITYNYLYSIGDSYHRCGVDWDDEGNPHMDELEWNTSKGKYCKENNIDIMIDDSEIYGKYMPNGTLYLQQWK